MIHREASFLDSDPIENSAKSPTHRRFPKMMRKRKLAVEWTIEVVPPKNRRMEAIPNPRPRTKKIKPKTENHTRGLSVK